MRAVLWSFIRNQHWRRKYYASANIAQKGIPTGEGRCENKVEGAQAHSTLLAGIAGVETVPSGDSTFVILRDRPRPECRRTRVDIILCNDERTRVGI